MRLSEIQQKNRHGGRRYGREDQKQIKEYVAPASGSFMSEFVKLKFDTHIRNRRGRKAT
jgi:hypothetical protein